MYNGYPDHFLEICIPLCNEPIGFSPKPHLNIIVSPPAFVIFVWPWSMWLLNFYVAICYTYLAKGLVYCDHVSSYQLLYFSWYEFNSSLNFCHRRTDAKWCIWAHRTSCTGGLKNQSPVDFKLKLIIRAPDFKLQLIIRAHASIQRWTFYRTVGPPFLINWKSDTNHFWCHYASFYVFWFQKTFHPDPVLVLQHDCGEIHIGISG